ncbi:hypothetical protein Hanom_Chr16g01494341 [Helianthus anomalus]
MDGVNEAEENGKISNLLDPDTEKWPLDESRKTGQTKDENGILLKAGNFSLFTYD